jgi:quercetin dioxygenase-like cupin family protein
VPIVFGKDIKWTEGPVKGESQALLFGDPGKPGIYGVLVKWMPGSSSPPHFHSTDRYAYVVSGTWWVSTSASYDRSKMYPVPAGSFVTDIANAMHWDGSAEGEKSPCLLLVVGEGPMTSTLWSKDPKGSGYVPPEPKQ